MGELKAGHGGGRREEEGATGGRGKSVALLSAHNDSVASPGPP